MEGLSFKTFFITSEKAMGIGLVYLNKADF